jgi:outer membrane protein TolC
MMWKRWTKQLLSGLIGLTLLGSQNGCKQQLFLEPADYKEAMKAGPSNRLEIDAASPIVPGNVVSAAAPATVLDPERPTRDITLKECIAIALEQGNVGGSSANPGVVSDQLSQFNGRGASGTDTIAAFAYDPAIAMADVERSLSKFDARWITSMTWNKVDQPILTLQQSFSNGDTATLTSTMAKPLPTGGVAGITFSTSYLNLSNPPPANSGFVALNTSYTPRVQFIFEQPLLQAFGVEINQLLPSHPGSQLISGFRSTGSGTEGILITRIRAEQQRAEFDRALNSMLLNVETAYWNLYGSYYNLAAQEEGFKQAFEAYTKIRERAQGGVERQQLEFQNESNVWQFQGQVLQARGQVLSSERSLRGMLGMRSDDGTRLVPVDEPTVVPLTPDFQVIANEAMQNLPELSVIRQDVKARQLDLLTQKNLRRPDLRLLTNYDVAGIGPSLGGTSPTENAFVNMSRNTFNSWQVGLRLDMPIGFRDANALVRQAYLNLQKTNLFLHDNERKALEVLADRYRNLFQQHESIKYFRGQRVALQKYVKLDRELQDQGAIKSGEFVSYVLNSSQIQQNLANATSQEFRAIAQYNIALAQLEHAKGTIQRYNNVNVADGPLPGYVQKKATDHFRAMGAAIKLREHPAELPMAPLPVLQPGTMSLPNPMLPPPPGTAVPATPGTIAPAPNSVRPWDLSVPKSGDSESSPKSEPMPKTSSLSVNPPRPLVPADAPGTFTPVDRVTLPKRPTGTVAEAPLSSPGTGVPVSIPVPQQ